MTTERRAAGKTRHGRIANQRRPLTAAEAGDAAAAAEPLCAAVN